MPKVTMLKLTGEYEIRGDVDLTALALAVEEAKAALGKIGTGSIKVKVAGGMLCG